LSGGHAGKLQLDSSGKEKGGISYSTLKHETTVTTDSVLNEEALQQKKNFSMDEDDSRE